MRTALLQITSSDDPAQNLETIRKMVAEAAGKGAEFILTPEVTNCVSLDRSHQNDTLSTEDKDSFLAGLKRMANDHGIWLLAGSLALKADPPETRFANRSLLLGPDGDVVARYDKLHMFDVSVSEAETYRESAGFAPGAAAVVADIGSTRIGLSICYDIRFAYLYRALAKAGAQIITVPSAFSPVTGAAHWEPLLRARAIETGCFVLAPAQTGTHRTSAGKERKTYGHSMAVSPWGEVLLDGGTDPGVHIVDLDLTRVSNARRKIPSLTHDRTFQGPS